jgi:integral membrane protein
MMGPAAAAAGGPKGWVAVLSTPVGRLRVISLLEAVSFLVLIFIAVPVKYAGDNPNPVHVMGPVHGALFILYVLSTWQVRQALSWSNVVTVKVLVAAVIPFAPFWVERWLRTQRVPARS